MSKSKRLFLLISLPVLLVLITGGSIATFNYSAQYRNDLALTAKGMKDLQDAEGLLKISSKNPLSIQNIAKAQQKFTEADQNFTLLRSDLQSLPGLASVVPVYGPRVQAALHVVPATITISELGVTACNLLKTLIAKLSNPLNPQAKGITDVDFAQIRADVGQINTEFATLMDEMNHLSPSDIQADPRISKGIATLHKDLPTIQGWLKTLNLLMPVMPMLLGIDKPANYLVEVLDSTELRPAGGFVGNYGILTISGAQLKGIKLTDIDLLDKPFQAAGNHIPLPQQYSWFDIGPSTWTMRDSNLDADFPTSARYGETTYQTEAGKDAIPVQGVIAITPWLIQNLLKITGPIAVPEYKETVTAANVIDRIHYHQLGGSAAGEQSGEIQSPDGKSSLRKHFMALLADNLMARVRQLASTKLSTLLQVGMDALRSKDIQMYFNDTTAEAFLSTLHLDNTIQSPPGDTLLVADANINANKANTFIVSAMNDQVTIDAQGNAVHHLTLSHAWTLPGNIYSRNTLYRDYAQVYIPASSSLQTQTGWQARGTSSVFNRQDIAGYFTLLFGQTNTVTLVWTVPHAATKDAHGWHYHELIQKQAGVTWTVNVQVTLPSCGADSHTSGGLVAKSGQLATFSGSLNEDKNFEVAYTCK